MNPTVKHRVALVLAAVIGGVIVYFAVKTSAKSHVPEPFRGELVSTSQPQSGSSSHHADRVSGMSGEMYSSIRDQVREAVMRTAAPGPELATHAATEYAAFLADLDIDRLLALGLEMNTVPHADTVAQFRMMLAGFPEDRKPAGWKTFNDLQALRWGFGISSLARWESVVLDTISAQYFPAGPETDEFAAIWRMNAPDGYEFSGNARAAFEIPDLYRKARMGEVASLLVSFAVQIKRGDHWLITLHLAEYQPGEWYPVAYRTDAAKSVTPFSADRAPRPN